MINKIDKPLTWLTKGKKKGRKLLIVEMKEEISQQIPWTLKK